MTLEEKISLLHGARDPRLLGQAGYWPGLPQLGIPALRLADGPPGVNVTKTATALPAPAGLAATFDREAARLYGVVLGRDAKALEQDILLAPHINIVRDPLFRRNHTTLSEDPFLNAQLGVALVEGIQSQGVMAQVKHFAAYNGSDDIVIDERTLHEIYLPAFEAAVKAGVASVMCSYSKVNGVWACEHEDLLNGVLRGRWGFEGFVTSDWGAVHNPLAVLHGLDLEMPGRPIALRGGPVLREGLKPLVESGAVPVSAIDQAVTRILGQMDRFGLLRRKPPKRPKSIDVEADARIIRQVAEQGAVLLRNEGGILPLAAGDLASLAVIGPTGGQLAAGFLGERGAGFESRMVAPLEALRRSAPKARIAYSVGCDLTGVPIPGPLVPAIGPDDGYSWKGTLNVPVDGEYTFMVQTGGAKGADGGGSITIDGNPIVRSGAQWGGSVVVKKWSSLLPTTDGRDNARATLHMAAGAHQMELTASSTGTSPLNVRFAWMTPQLRQTNVAAAVAAAKVARAVVVFAWNGMGNSFSLPEDQDELIEKVASVNPRTVVVLNAGGPVAMPWRDRVQAILEMWYPGQEGGWATANLLLGRVNPSGRLPVTFPTRLEDAPARAPGNPERMGVPALPGGAGVLFTDLLGKLLGAAAGGRETFTATYSEGLAVGYRWYDAQDIRPLYPFGHGLSYTRFEYSNLMVRRSGDGIDVGFTVTNTGSRAGAEVAQVYLGPSENTPVEMMPKSLAGFERIELAAGRRKAVSMHIGPRALSYWSVQKHDWVMADGNREVFVGASSRDIRLKGSIPAPPRPQLKAARG